MGGYGMERDDVGRLSRMREGGKEGARVTYSQANKGMMSGGKRGPYLSY